MKQIKLLLIGLILSVLAAESTAAEAYLGQFLYKYDGGNTYRVIVNNAQSMSWQCIEGTEKGASGVETPQRFKVSTKIYFATWVEKTGINVSQVIDLKGMKVYSTIVDGKERYVLVGKIIREK